MIEEDKRVETKIRFLRETIVLHQSKCQKVVERRMKVVVLISNLGACCCQQFGIIGKVCGPVKPWTLPSEGLKNSPQEGLRRSGYCGRNQWQKDERESERNEFNKVLPKMKSKKRNLDPVPERFDDPAAHRSTNIEKPHPMASIHGTWRT